MNPHAAYPQAPFVNDAELGLPKVRRHACRLETGGKEGLTRWAPIHPSIYLQRIRLLPNPTIFSINEIAFGVTSADVLWSLKSQEYFRKAPDVEPPEPGTEDPLAKDVMARTCRQLLRHRR